LPSSASSFLREAGLRPRKGLGQHFLRDRTFLRHIIAAADLSGEDQVIEVGPGTGVLTDALAEAARSVLAVELDDALAERLSNRFRDNEKVRVMAGNALDLDPCEHFKSPYKLVANIPYYITGPLVRHFLETTCQPELAVLMVQRAVAERMAAGPGKMSLFGISVQYYAAVKIVARVPASAFYPRPKVDSAIVRLSPYRPFVGDNAIFFDVVRAGFSTRRKQLHNSLAAGLQIEKPDADALLHAAGIDPTTRAEALTLGDWEELADAWTAHRRRD
jgi:16S rRNA (adenine1518-N6/adenine1519-N6)-dimethyltransferase